MAFTNLPPLPQGINTGYAKTATAIGSGTTQAPTNTQKLFTAGPNGALVSKITASVTANYAANVLALYGSKDGGTTKYQILPKQVASGTVSTTVSSVVVNFGYTLDDHLMLSPNEELYVGIMVADPATSGWLWRAEGRDF